MNFAAVNRGDVKDSDIDLIMDSIVDSLFSVFVNLGELPWTFHPALCYEMSSSLCHIERPMIFNFPSS